MYIYQKHEKDCLQATLANLLNLKYEDIPEFYEFYLKRNSNDDFLAEVDQYLEKIGYFRILFDVSVTEDRKIRIPFFCSLENFKCIGILEKKDRNYSHAVLLEVRRNENQFSIGIEHDPKRDTDYVLQDLIQLELIIKRDLIC
jgi:hypothetical protein